VVIRLALCHNANQCTVAYMVVWGQVYVHAMLAAHADVTGLFDKVIPVGVCGDAANDKAWLLAWLPVSESAGSWDTACQGAAVQPEVHIGVTRRCTRTQGVGSGVIHESSWWQCGRQRGVEARSLAIKA